MKKQRRKYPINYNGKWWNRKDCDEVWVELYESGQHTQGEYGIYLCDDVWVFPDGPGFNEEYN